MSRDYLLYLEDIEQALARIARYTQGLTHYSTGRPTISINLSALDDVAIPGRSV